MAKYVCSVCGYIYEEEKGIPEAGIAPGTKWEDLPEDWDCPLCGSDKTVFEKEGEYNKSLRAETIFDAEDFSDMKELSPTEISALCTNLARGCEKQYNYEQAGLFMELAKYFKNSSVSSKNPNLDQLIDLIDNDLNSGFIKANSVASKANDRGALRALVWSSKVTRILKSLLQRYEKLGEAMLENSGVYVCSICGFIYVGNNLPEVCPICKVPNWKFEKVERR